METADHKFKIESNLTFPLLEAGEIPRGSTVGKRAGAR